MTHHPLTQRLHELADYEVTGPVDLWPRISARVSLYWPQGSSSARPTGHDRLRRGPIRRLVVSIALIALLLIVSAPVTVFASATLRGHLQRFGFVLLEPATPTTSPATDPGLPQPQPGVMSLTPVSLTEAQQHVPFTIRLPQQLPLGLTLQDVIVGPEPSVVLRYRSDTRPLGRLSIQQTQVSGANGGYGIPASKAEATIVHGEPAIFARGTWDEHGQWHADADVAKLSWSHDGLVFVIQCSGLGLSSDDLVRIAESLR